ncbi:MAG: hypothetical protein NC124_11575 [Clostridium sp.]|nr:hypothetical protein [Clostridium sp.]
MKHILVFGIIAMLVISMTGCKTEDIAPKDMREENVSVETRIIQQTSTEASDPQLDEEIVDPIAEEPQLQIDDINESLNGSSPYSDEPDQIISAEPYKGNVD